MAQSDSSDSPLLHPPRVIMNDRSPLIADFPPNELSNLVPRSYRVTVTEIYNRLVVKGLGKRLQTHIHSNPTPDNMLRLRKITRDQIDIYTQLRVNIYKKIKYLLFYYYFI